uniref:Thiol-transferase Tc52 n=1 Tax=Ganoderma boninense TaxID=34458 RepID=A0A5K1K4K9_9APHY
MRLTLLFPEVSSALNLGLHYWGTDLALEFSSSSPSPCQPACGVRVLLTPDTGLIQRSLRPSPLLAHVEELWVTSNAPFAGAVLLPLPLPPKTRSLALTITDETLLLHTLAQLLRDAHSDAPLDTLCVVTRDARRPGSGPRGQGQGGSCAPHRAGVHPAHAPLLAPGSDGAWGGRRRWGGVPLDRARRLGGRRRAWMAPGRRC